MSFKVRFSGLHRLLMPKIHLFKKSGLQRHLYGNIQSFYASQIQGEKQPDMDAKFLSCEQFHSYLTALQIRYPGLSTLYSLNAARIDFLPYQFRPVLKFIKSDRPRLLIADDVGVDLNYSHLGEMP